MADRKLRFLLSATDQGASKTLGDVGEKGHHAGEKIASGFSKLGGLIKGEVGEALGEVGEKLEHFGKGNRIAATGAALGALGGVLAIMGAKEQQATQQLDNAITNSGHSVEEYEGKIESTVKSMEQFGYAAVDTKQSLQTLVNATHDPEKALNLMGEAADLAASKHISLESAATQLAKVVGGHGARTLAAYNIELVKNKDGTTDWAATNQKLAGILSGQAAAASDTFTGRLRALRTEVEDNVAEFGQKYGPAILIAGTAITTLGPLVSKAGSGLRSLGAAARGAGVASQEGAAATVAADEEIVVANEAAAASEEEVAVAAKGSRLAMLGGATAMAAVVVGGYMAGNALGAMADKGHFTVDASDALAGSLGSLSTALVNSGGDTEGAAKQWLDGQVKSMGLADAVAKSGVTVEELTTAIEGGDSATGALLAKMQKTGHVSGSTAVALKLLSGGYEKTMHSEEEAASTTEQHTSVLDEQASTLHTSVTALQAAKAASDKNKSSMAQATLQMQVENDAAGLLSASFDKLNGHTIDAEEANIAFKNSVHDLNAAEKENGHSLNDNTVKGRANVSTVLASIKAAQQHADAVGKQTGSVSKATSTFEADRAALAKHLIALGYNKDAVQALMDKYGKLPAVKLTKAELDAAAAREKIDSLQRKINAIKQGRVPGLNANTLAGREKIAELQRRIDALHGKSINIDVYNTTYNSTKGGASGGLKANAGGTDFFSGGMTTIAEREPEAIYLPRGSRVTPMSRMGGGGDGGTLNVTINVPPMWGGNNLDLGRTVAGVLEQYVGAGGKIRVQKGIN